MSVFEILIPRRFYSRETLVPGMLLRRGEISRDEFMEQLGNPNSSELPEPGGVHIKL